MLKIYRNSKLSTRIISILTLAVFFSFISFYYGYDWLFAGSLIVGFGLVLEAFFIHTRFLVTSLIVFLNLMLTGFVSFLIYEILQYNPATQFIGLVNLILLQIGGIAATISIALVSYFYAKGAMWINVLLGYIIYNISLVGFIISFGQDNTSLLSIVLALALSLGFLTLRSVFPLQSDSVFDLDKLPQSKKTNSLLNKLEKTFPNLKVKKSSKRTLVAFDNKTVYFIVPISVKDKLVLNKKQLLIDEVDLTTCLESILLDAQLFSKNYKVNQKIIVPLLYVDRESALPRKLLGIKVRKRTQPDRILGTVTITSDTGFQSLIKANNDRKTLNNAILTKLSNL